MGSIEKKKAASGTSDTNSNVSIDIVDRRIYLCGKFNEQSIGDIIWGLQQMDQEIHHDDIDIYITSPGGDTYGFLALYDYINLMESKVNTIAMGQAQSAGCFLLATGTGIRRATTNTTIMMHELASGSEDRFTDMKIYTDYLQRLQERLNLILAKHTGQPIERVTKDIKRDFFMMPEEALEYGLIDEII